MSNITSSKEYLQWSVRALREKGIDHCGINGYFCLMDFILQNGREYKPGTECWGKGRRECFNHAAKAALRNRDYTYVEGYACMVLPVHHAWLLDKDGNVIEPTWCQMGKSYYGIPFRTDWVRAQRKASSYRSIIDQVDTDFRTMRTPRGKWIRI